MSSIAPEQILIVAGFLLLLIVAAVFIRANSGTLSKKLQAGRRMRVTEAAMLGQGARAVLVTIDQRDFLVVTPRRGAASVTPLVPAEDAA